MAKPRATTIQQRFGFKDDDLKKPNHDMIMIWLDENINAVVNDLISKYPEQFIDCEETAITNTIWEQPIMSGKYCIGFIDMWIPDYRICIEVKTEIPSVGELIRQIAMYKQYTISQPFFAVVSPNDRFASVLESQGILFYKYTGDPLDVAMT
ncbi:MAG: hypothetical protein ACXAEN_22770 [Candidatus Thorarchaeota archaeon]|jgi:hypothetical protein